MFILIDNYDSFTYNLFHYLGELGARLEVHRNDKITVDEVMAKHPQGIILSPGPCTPDTAGICLELIKRAAAAKVPLFGVCLGHQAIGQVFGGEVVRAPKPMHGKISPVAHEGTHLFAGLSSPFDAGRYHSLVIDPAAVPPGFKVTAWVENDSTIMGIRHESLPIYGVQFHPESVMTAAGHRILQNFLEAK